MTFEASYNFIGKMGRWELWGGQLWETEYRTGNSLVQNNFLFFVGFFAFTSAKEFSSMVRNQTLLNIWLLPVYSIKCWHLITTDFCSVLKSSSKKIEHKKNHKKFSLTFKKEVAMKANKSLKKKKQMFGILKNENEKKNTKKQPAKLNIKH